MDELIISVSGLRGVVGTSLTPHVVTRYVAAFAQLLRPGPIVVTQDGRTTGAMLADQVTVALRAAGRMVIDAGVAATPTTGVLVRETDAAGGVQVSASHNPPEYNGLKLFGKDGRVIPAPLGERVAEAYHQGQETWCSWHDVASLSSHPDPHAAHLARVLALVDIQRIQRRGFTVLLDSNRGAGSLLGRRLLRALGCKVRVLGGEPDGWFEHRPEPTAENLRQVGQRVRDANAVVGFCQDPDADRLALIDERGEYIGEEYTLALCMDHVLANRPGAVVTNCATSRMSQDIAEKHGAVCYRAAVGEANVADVMLQHNAVFGGEGNGGPIEPRVGYVRDSFVGMAYLLDALSQRDETISQWAQSLPKYHIHKDKAPLARDRMEGAMTRLQERFPDAAASRQDGLRLDWDDRWLLLRASNTEPIIRAIAEAPTLDDAKSLTHTALQIVS